MLSTDAKPDPPRINQSSQNGTERTFCKYRDELYDNQSNLSKKQKENKKLKTKSSENVVNYNINYSNHVSIGTTNTYICNVNQVCETNQLQNKTNNECAILEMPHNVKKLSFSEQQLTVKNMFFIKTHLGYGWRKFFKSLGYTNGQLDQFVENYRIKGIDEVIYQLLLDWKCLNGKNSSVGTIVNHLWKCQQYECAQIFASSL
ncbi:protein immune deficiency [Cotesia glomerata]|uniref:Death domain-containing protein n=1 Tax=Cotesia glomerata TaxID=32391 RepID=A0AAV7ILL0_COTGL|nr:protein immune deficiency [Cotesia glomerata]KAH0552615.1 hypothetical protein KQX54_013339 [Cotesia glomerata]